VKKKKTKKAAPSPRRHKTSGRASSKPKKLTLAQRLAPRLTGMALWEAVGQRIQNLRASINMTQADLARKTGMRQSHISRIEAGMRGVPRRRLPKMAKALEVREIDLDPNVP
jgi:ribosome-binding protein aMBF1 (putative translation factor)